MFQVLLFFVFYQRTFLTCSTKALHVSVHLESTLYYLKREEAQLSMIYTSLLKISFGPSKKTECTDLKDVSTIEVVGIEPRPI